MKHRHILLFSEKLFSFLSKKNTVSSLRLGLSLILNTDEQRFSPCVLQICPLTHMFKKAISGSKLV
jgi:hypothetical protein